jgi:Rrf2 family nitric oxide-sensitive transcriptional repressor
LQAPKAGWASACLCGDGHRLGRDLAAAAPAPHHRLVRGAGGGVLLAVELDQVRAGALMRQLEGDQPVVECFRADGGCCTLTGSCRLSGFIHSGREEFYRSLDRHSIAECLPAPKVAKR